jgi:hypothetical protein
MESRVSWISALLFYADLGLTCADMLPRKVGFFGHHAGGIKFRKLGRQERVEWVLDYCPAGKRI